MIALRPLERVARNAALGLRFWDIATGQAAVDGLRVEVFHRANPHVRRVAKPGPSGVYVCDAVPGLRDFEFADAEPASALWPAATRPYRIEVSDPEGRYLPMAFDADLPARGLFSWLAPWLSPPQAVPFPFTPGSPPPAMVDRIPLFSAPSRPPPDPLAVVHAHLVEEGTRRELAWTLLAVSIGGVHCGLGLSDERGRALVLFPYPEPPRRVLASPVPAHDDFAWEVELTVFGTSPSPVHEPAPFADLALVLESAAFPRGMAGSPGSPWYPMRLAYRQTLVARTAGAVGADASVLLVS